MVTLHCVTWRHTVLVPVHDSRRAGLLCESLHFLSSPTVNTICTDNDITGILAAVLTNGSDRILAMLDRRHPLASLDFRLISQLVVQRPQENLPLTDTTDVFQSSHTNTVSALSSSHHMTSISKQTERTRQHTSLPQSPATHY